MRGRILAWPVFMSDVSQLATYRDAAITALLAAEYDTAIQQAMAAKLFLATMPSLKQADREVAWNSQAIDEFIAQCRQLATTAAVAAGGIRQTKVTYARPTSTDAY